MLLGVAEKRLGIVDHLARLIPDRRDPTAITLGLTDMIRARISAICCGSEDADDLDALRSDPAFELARGRLPDSGRDLCSQPTPSRLENAPRLRDVIRLAAALVDIWMDLHATLPAAVTLDIDDTCDVVQATSSCRCSTPATTSAAFCRSTSTTPPEAALSRRSCAPARRRPASRSMVTYAASSADAGRTPAS